MIRIGVLGDIGSGKSFVAKSFGYPVFNADEEVSKLYQKEKKIYIKLKKFKSSLLSVVVVVYRYPYSSIHTPAKIVRLPLVI